MTRLNHSLLSLAFTTLLLVASSLAVCGQDHRVMSADEINSKLAQLCKLEYQEKPFREVAMDLEKTIGASIVLDQSAIDDSLTVDEPVTCELSDVRLRTALNVMLDQFNATFLISDSMVKIISKDVAGDPEFHRRIVIDCRPLLEQIATNEVRYPGELRMAFRSGGNSGGVFNLPPGTNLPAQEPETEIAPPSDEQLLLLARRQASNILQNLVRSTVCPDHWDDTNGDFSSKMVGGLMVVAADERCLHEIRSLVIDLQQTFDAEQ